MMNFVTVAINYMRLTQQTQIGNKRFMLTFWKIGKGSDCCLSATHYPTQPSTHPNDTR